MKSKSLILSLLAGLMVVACAKDRDQDDYNNDQNNKGRAELQSVEGLYTGLVVSEKDHSSLGILQVRLDVTSVADPAQPNQRPTSHPALSVSAEFQGHAGFSQPAQPVDVSYDPKDGSFVARICVVDAPATPPAAASCSAVGSGNTTSGTTPGFVMVIQGTVSQGTNLNGYFFADGHFASGGTISLTPDQSRTLTDLVAQYGPFAAPWDPGTTIFNGNYNDQFGKARHATLTIAYPQPSSAQELQDIFGDGSVKVVRATFQNKELGVGHGFAAAKWDLHNLTLHAADTVTDIGGTANLDCDKLDLLKKAKYDFTCQFVTSNLASAITAHFSGTTTAPANK